MTTFKFDLLTVEEEQKILDSTYRLLEEIGIKVYNEEAIRILKDAGAIVDDRLVKLPRKIVEKAIESAPSKVDIFDQQGNIAMELFDRNSYYGPGVTCPFFFDVYTGERREARKSDVEQVAKVADQLENIDFVMSLCNVGDKEANLADIHEVEAILNNCNKPFVTWAFDERNLVYIVEMCQAVAGSYEKLREKPFFITYLEPITPLVHPKESLDKLIYLSKKGLPFVYSPGMTFGGTAPVTLAGALTIGLADAFVGLTIAQLINPGTPVICGAGGGVLDMWTTQAPYGSPEMSLNDAGATQIFRRVGVPCFGLAGATDSKETDFQAGMETSIQFLMYAGSGSNLIHDSGMMDLGMTGSAHLLCLCDEVIGNVKRLQRGFSLDENGFAFDTIKEVGQGGTFITSQHTLKNFRKEMFAPKLGLRQKYEVWEEEGKKSMSDLAKEKVIKILEENTVVPKSIEVQKKISEIVEAAKIE